GGRWAHRPGKAWLVPGSGQRRLPAHRRLTCAVRVPGRVVGMNDRAGGQQDGPAAGSEAVSGPSGRPLVGVLGGLGPAATLDLYAKIVALTPASTDQEHIRLLIDAAPEVPVRNRSVAGAGPSSAPALIAKARRLAAAGAELLVLACNAAHAYQADIVAAVELPFIGIVDEAVQAAAQL